MISSTTAGHDPAELGDLERAILELVWKYGVLSADQVRIHLDQQSYPLKESTIRTVLRRLEEKGYLHHSTENRTFFYRPAESRQAVAGRAVQRIVDWFCAGSVEDLLVGMVDSAVLDKRELQRLADRIASAKGSPSDASASHSVTAEQPAQPHQASSPHHEDPQQQQKRTQE